MSTDEFLVTSTGLYFLCLSARDCCFPPSRWQVEIRIYNSAASVQSLIYFLHLPVKLRLNKDAKLCAGEAEALSYVGFCYFGNRVSII